LLAIYTLRFIYTFWQWSAYLIAYCLWMNCAESCTPLLIIRNVDGSTYFNRSWQLFRSGFGRPDCNFWLGNGLLHQLTRDNVYKLRIDVQALTSGNWFMLTTKNN